jgi:hypothetical protein
MTVRLRIGFAQSYGCPRPPGGGDYYPMVHESATMPRAAAEAWADQIRAEGFWHRPDHYVPAPRIVIIDVVMA